MVQSMDIICGCVNDMEGGGKHLSIGCSQRVAEIVETAGDLTSVLGLESLKSPQSLILAQHPQHSKTLDSYPQLR